MKKVCLSASVLCLLILKVGSVLLGESHYLCVAEAFTLVLLTARTSIRACCIFSKWSVQMSTSLLIPQLDNQWTLPNHQQSSEARLWGEEGEEQSSLSYFMDREAFRCWGHGDPESNHSPSHGLTCHIVYLLCELFAFCLSLLDLKNKKHFQCHWLVRLKLVKTVHFMLHIFCHSKKQTKKKLKEVNWRG